MKHILQHFDLKVNNKVFLKDPLSSTLGKKIIAGSIDMIDDIGFDHFTFKKLATQIGSTEASLYRYFENKHKLLLYLTIWYWRWMGSKVFMATLNVDCAEDRLNRCLNLLIDPIIEDSGIEHVNEVKLNRIVNIESSKAYLTKEVDEENKDGVFKGYKDLVAQVSEIILEISPDFKYPHTLVSTVIEGVHHQRFFQEHLPRLTENFKGEDSVKEFYSKMVYSTIGLEAKSK